MDPGKVTDARMRRTADVDGGDDGAHGVQAAAFALVRRHPMILRQKHCLNARVDHRPRVSHVGYCQIPPGLQK